MTIQACLHAAPCRIRRATLLVCALIGAYAYSVVSLGASENQGANWLSVGRTYAEDHHSPLDNINDRNVGQLGLAWFLDLPNQGALHATPLSVDGVLYFSGSNGRVYAVGAKNGRKLWEFDPDLSHHPVNPKAVLYGANRGVAYWQGKVYVGTTDGRLVSLEARTGHVAWSVNTFEAPNMPKTITGAPHVFNGKVMIGFRGSPGARGYVTAYNAESGKQLWRFYTVPGDPAKGFENAAMGMAAKTWGGQWWKSGGNASVWDGITYDPEMNRIYIGTADVNTENDPNRTGGDMLFASSIIALDADTGTYIWHLQLMPHDIIEYDASLQMILASLNFEGKRHKVLMQAAKSGFFYVIDRSNGKLLSADKFEKVTWADHVDLPTGRPVEAPQLREEHAFFEIWPVGAGAHNWQPMAFDPRTGVAYIPTMRLGFRTGPNGGLIVRDPAHPDESTGGLLAWDPVAGKKRWEVRYPESFWNGGVLSTAGNLVFQGTGRGQLIAYRAGTGERLWTFDAGLGINSAPITYTLDGVQYLSVLVGYGASEDVASLCNYGWHFNEQPRRLLTFALAGSAHLPPSAPLRFTVNAVDDPSIVIDVKQAEAGATSYNSHRCFSCHGGALKNYASVAPDLRESRVALNWDAFRSVVHDGALASLGMPQFSDITDQDLRAIYLYIRQQAREAARSAH
jgi:quinohemoprotein ethanol dehydrogenase